MRYKLSDGRYSKKEREVFALLTTKPTSSTDLMIKYYGRKVPPNGRIRMMNVIRRLQNKLAYYGEEFDIVRSPRAGPHPVTFHIE